MRATVVVWFAARGAPWNRVRPILERAGLGDALGRGPTSAGYGGELAADSPALLELRDGVARAFGETLVETRFERFTDGELRAALLLHLEVALEPRESKTLYDFGVGCPTCGAGAAQLSPMRVNPSEIRTKGKLFRTLTAETALAEDAALTAVAAGITGFSLGHVVSATTGARLPWLQLRVDRELPRLAAAADVRREEICGRCRRSGWFGPERRPLTLVYDLRDLDLDDVPDISLTWERWGYGSGMETMRHHPVLAQPAIVCKPLVYDLFKRLRVKNARFRPVDLR